MDTRVHKVLNSLPATPLPGPNTSADQIVEKVLGYAAKGVKWMSSDEGMETVAAIFSLAEAGGSLLLA